MESIKEIQQQFNDVIRFSQDGIPEPNTDKLFAKWETAKAPIYKAFGNQLIYELPEKVTFELSEEAKNERILSFIGSLWALGLHELGRFLERQKKGFFENRVVEECTITHKHLKIIPKNSKLIKAFKYFIKDKEMLNDLQNLASQIIQENKIEGTFCLSIHPLDYLSISENTYNWRSCHALDGEYRAGNLSYMMDQSTIVCYLKGEDKVKLPHFPDNVPWNSKKWRVLLYLSNDWRMMFAGKQYPFLAKTGMNKVLEIAKEKFRDNPVETWYAMPSENAFWTPWTEYNVSEIENNNIKFNFNNEFYIPLSDKLVSLYDLMVDQKGSKQYNDVLNSTCYKPVYSYLAYRNTWSDEIEIYANSHVTKFEIGGMTYCLRCGEEEVVDSAGSMMCYDCEYKYGTTENDLFCFCSNCGGRILTEDSCYVEDEVYCEHCYDKIAARCDNCGDSYNKEDMFYDEENDVYYCKWCN